MKSRERSVYFYDLKAVSRFHGIEVVPLPMPTNLAIELAYTIYALNSGPKMSIDAGRHITLEDWQRTYDKTEHRLVFSCADPSLADVAFKHLTNGTGRMAGKSEQEAIDISCHVLIKTDPLNSGSALMLVTGGSGISAAKMATSLGRFLRHAVRHPATARHFVRKHPSDEMGRSLKLRVKFEVEGHQSRHLQKILETGYIEDIELVTEPIGSFDGDDRFQVRSRSLVIKSVSNERFGIGRLKQLVSRPLEGHVPTKAKIRFKEKPDARIESRTFETNALEAAFVRKELIKFDTDILSRYSKVNMTVIDKMRELL